MSGIARIPVSGLDPDKVHVSYAFAANTGPDVLSHCTNLVSEGEQERCDRFVFEKDRRLYLLAHGMLRKVLSRYAPAAPQAWSFESNRYGKPEISDPPLERRLRFNLSHTDGLVACAVTTEVDVGVDVEDARRMVEVESLAPRFFSAPEAEALLRLPAAEQQDRFFDYWTLKEAYIKARGMGLSIPLADFSFDLQSEPIRIAFAETLQDDPARWQFVRIHAGPHHKLSVAVRRGAEHKSISFGEFTPEEFISSTDVFGT